MEKIASHLTKALRSFDKPVCEIGIDIEDLSRTKSWLKYYGWNEFQLIFTHEEWQQIEKEGVDVGLILSAKESTAKALGTGFRNISWLEIGIQILPNRFTGYLTNRASIEAQSKSISFLGGTWMIGEFPLEMRKSLRSGGGRQFPCHSQIDSSLDQSTSHRGGALKDRDCAELPVQQHVITCAFFGDCS